LGSCSLMACKRAQAALLLDHIDCDFRTVRFGKPGLVFKTGRNDAVPGLMGVAVFVELEKLGRERLAAGMALAFVGINVNPQSLSHGGFLGRVRGPGKAARIPHMVLF